jgi:hypothetical protein
MNFTVIKMICLITWDVDVAVERWGTADSKRAFHTATAERTVPCQPCVSEPRPGTRRTDTPGPAVRPCALDGTER